MSKSPGRVLKEKGLIPREWKLRELSRGQKSWVTKQARKFSDLVNHPDYFGTVAAKSKSQRAQARDIGFDMANGRAIVPVPWGGKVRRSGDRIVVSSPGRTMEITPAGAESFLEEYRKMQTEPLLPNQKLTIQIGKSNAANLRFDSIEDLEKYVHIMDLHSDDTLEHISIVKFTEHEQIPPEAEVTKPPRDKLGRFVKRGK
jgi:hypothetical protein